MTIGTAAKALYIVQKLKKDNLKRYRKFVPEQMEDMLHIVGYISFSKSNEYSKETTVTFKGLEQLRILEEIQIKRKAIWISIIGLIISVLAFAKSVGWI